MNSFHEANVSLYARDANICKRNIDQTFFHFIEQSSLKPQNFQHRILINVKTNYDWLKSLEGHFERKMLKSSNSNPLMDFKLQVG